MIEFKERIEIPSSNARCTLVLESKPTQEEMTTKCKLHSVVYRFDDDPQNKVDESMNGFNNCLIQQSVIAIMEYLHPGMFIHSMEAVITKRSVNDMLHPTVIFSFTILDDCGNPFTSRSDENIIYTVNDAFQPLIESGVPNVVSTFKEIEHAEGCSFKDFIEDLIDKMGDNDSVKKLIDPRERFLSKINRDDLKLRTTTYLTRRGIAAHLVHIKDITGIYEKYVSRKIKKDEVAAVVSSIICDICNGTLIKISNNAAFMLPTVHVHHTHDDVILIVDFTNGVNMLIVNPESNSKGIENELNTSAHIRIKNWSKTNRGVSIDVDFTQTDNIIELPERTMAVFLLEYLNYQGMFYSKYAEFDIIRNIPGKYLPFCQVTHPSTSDIGTAMYSIYDGTLDKRSLDVNNPRITVPAFGTVYALNDFTAYNHETDLVGVTDEFTVKCGIACLNFDDRVKTGYLMNRVSKNEIFDIQYIMKHTCIFKNKKYSMIIVSVSGVDGVIKSASDEFVEEFCENLRGVKCGLTKTIAITDATIVYLSEGK